MDWIRVTFPDGTNVWVDVSEGMTEKEARLLAAQRFGYSEAEADLFSTQKTAEPPIGRQTLGADGAIGVFRPDLFGVPTGQEPAAQPPVAEPFTPGTVGFADDNSGAPPGVIPPAQQQTGDLNTDPALMDADLRRAAYLNALADTGVNPEGVLGYAARQQFAPAWLLGELAPRFFPNMASSGDAPGAVRQRFGEILGGQSGFGTGTLGSQIQQAFDLLRGAGGDLGAQFSAPAIGTETGDANFALGRDLARQAAISKFGGFGASLLPTDTLFKDRFDRQRESAGFSGQVPNFLDFAATQFGI